MADFKFDPEKHIYTLDGKRLVSATQLIAEAGLSDYSKVNPELLARAKNFGDAVHLMVKLFMTEKLDLNTLDPALYGPLQALEAWYFENGEPQGGQYEVPGYHPKYLYSGTPDMLFPDIVVDVKTRIYDPLCDPIQLAYYDHMDNNGKRKRYVLELKQDGSYVYTLANQTKASSNLAWSRARYLIDLHNMKEEIKRWK